jgi:FMN phosphatase YigB (HAD superfamily)
MKQLYWSLLAVFYMISGYAQIIQVSEMREVFHYFDNVDSKTLAIFDVDMVLLQPSDPAFQMANMKRFSNVSKRIMKKIPSDKQAIFLSLMSLSSDPVLIDSQTPYFLQEILRKGVLTMALTANLTGEFKTIKRMEKWRVDSLRQLDIDFSKGAPSQTPLVFNDLPAYRGNFSTYLDGILFVNGTVISKGEALIAFLQKIDFYPNKIIFIDDREENLKSVQLAIQKLDKCIEYQGLHFIGAQHYPSKMISEQEFESRWLELADTLTQEKK